ncbi:hypothetical protein CJ030_MR5G020720 [Morella rubra]|uniref:Uncharacterized protein n=1 Tax=Morella rubra TaxID=262757 RepID=A0A6A1VI54_9ROSI|nr:hypothetical protein CJ030_MR5G020720 [Morella rubra]
MDSVCDLFVSEEFQRRSAINMENRAKLKIIHTSGARFFQRVSKLLEKMEALQLQHELEGKSYTEVEIFDEELGMKEARLEIVEMRARQMEFEVLLVKQSNMEQTMREHLQ